MAITIATDSRSLEDMKVLLSRKSTTSPAAQLYQRTGEAVDDFQRKPPNPFESQTAGDALEEIAGGGPPSAARVAAARRVTGVLSKQSIPAGAGHGPLVSALTRRQMAPRIGLAWLPFRTNRNSICAKRLGLNRSRAADVHFIRAARLELASSGGGFEPAVAALNNRARAVARVAGVALESLASARRLCRARGIERDVRFLGRRKRFGRQ